MFDNPHGHELYTEEDYENDQKNYVHGKKYPDSVACFHPGSNSVDIYFCYVKALQYLFARDHSQHATLMRIALESFPTSISIIDYPRSDFIDIYDKKTSGGPDALACIGTTNGKVLAYKVRQSD